MRPEGSCFFCHRMGHWLQDCSAGRVYLRCPYAQKDRAKAALGARWDPEKGMWWTYRPLEFVRQRFPQWKPHR